MDDKKTPDPKPAEPVIAGGPGAEPERPEPKLVAVKYGGRELQVPEDVATAWQEREREFDQRFSRQGAELGDLRQRVKQPAAEPRREEPKEPDISTLWFEDPKAAYQKIVTDVETRVESRYRQDQALKGFWDGFYRANDDLREDEWVVQGVFRDHFEEIADLPRVKAQEKLGELTREKILRLTRKVKPTNDNRPRTDLLEPASGDRPLRAARQEDEGPRSISELISERRRERTTPRANRSA